MADVGPKVFDPHAVSVQRRNIPMVAKLHGANFSSEQKVEVAWILNNLICKLLGQRQHDNSIFTSPSSLTAIDANFEVFDEFSVAKAGHLSHPHHVHLALQDLFKF